MDFLDYREKLGIGFADQDKVLYFMVKIFNILDADSTILRTQIDENEYFNFCNMTGTPMQHGSLYGDGLKLITDVLHRNSKTLPQFLAYYIAFVNCQTDNKCKKLTKENYKNIVCNMLDEAHIPFDLLEDKDGYFIFPKGAKELDDALVSEPLEWLADYPTSRKAFVKALREYSETTSDNASDVADKFRKTLESFFQEFFGGNKSLENYKNAYGTYLKGRGVPKEVSGNFETLLQAYTSFMNNYAKHRDATSNRLLEYLMYQTGNIIRLLITLKQEEDKQ